MFVQQDGLKVKNNYFGKVNQQLNYIDYGSVQAINYASDTLDVITNDGIVLNGVVYMSNKMYDEPGEASGNTHNHSGYCDMPTVGSRVLITFIDGEVAHPVVLGCIPDVRRHRQTLGSEKESDRGRRFYLHESHFWEKVDKKGNQEIYFPDGSTISVSGDVTGNTTALSDEARFKLPTNSGDSRQSPKTIRIKHSTGTVIKIKADGTVVIKAAKIELGDDSPGDSLVLGSKLTALFNMHTHPTGVGPSGVPVIPMASTDFSSIITIK